MWRRVFVVITALAFVSLLVASTGTAAEPAGNGDNAHRCLQGGWQTLYTATGAPFANVGDCVSYSARGGELFTAVADVSLSWEPSIQGAFFGVNVFVTNGGPSSVTVGVEVVANLGGVSNPSMTLAPGETRLVGGLFSTGTTITGYAQVTSATAHDPDSTPNNSSGVAVEDDEVTFTGPSPGA
jgi:hypothetical protein